MPDALKFPGMLLAIVKLVSGKLFTGFGGRIVYEFVALALGHTVWTGRFTRGRSGLVPRLAPIIGALDDLPKPAAGLRSIDAIRIGRRAFEVIQFPACQVRAADLPVFAFAVCVKNECALARAYEYPYLAHALLLRLLGTAPILSEGRMWESTAEV